MKYPVATLAAGFRALRAKDVHRCRGQLAHEIELMTAMRNGTRAEIESYVEGMRVAIDLFESGHFHDGETDSLVNNKLVAVLEEHVPKSNRGYGANYVGSNRGTMREQQKKVARCRDACNEAAQKSSQELFLEELLVQGITEVSDYTFQKAGFTNKLGHVFASGKKAESAV